MKSFKCAFIYVDRNWKKSTLLFALFFIIANMMLATILILRTTYQTREHFFRNMPNQIGIADESQELEGLSLELLDYIRELPDVHSSRYGLSSNAVSQSLLLAHFPTLASEHPCVRFSICTFQFRGVSSTQMGEIDSNVFRLSEGRFFLPEEIETQSHVAIISRELADRNELSLGDTIDFQAFLPNFENILANNVDHSLDGIFFGELIEFEIVGVLELVSEITGEFATNIMEEVNATIFISNPMASYLNEQTISLFHEHLSDEMIEEILAALPSMRALFNGGIPYAFFTLYDFRDYDAFYENVRPLFPESVPIIGTPQTWGFDGMARSMDAIQNVLNYFLYGTIVACALISGLSILMLFKDRRHEIGIYLSLGVKQLRLITQYLIEIFLITIPAFIIAILTGNWLASYLNSWLLENFLSTDLNSLHPQWTLFFYTNTITDESIYRVHQVNLEGWAIALAFFILVLTSVIFSILPLMFVLRIKINSLLMSGRVR